MNIMIFLPNIDVKNQNPIHLHFIPMWNINSTNKVGNPSKESSHNMWGTIHNYKISKLYL